jgi:hypothetical protein
MKKGDEGAQVTGFDVMSGHLGYLREAYHGEPYATKVLVPEAFHARSSEATIKAEILSQRLPTVLKVAAERNKKLYKGQDQEGVLKSFVDFVALAERQEKETGKPVTIIASY